MYAFYIEGVFACKHVCMYGCMSAYVWDCVCTCKFVCYHWLRWALDRLSSKWGVYLW